METVKFDTEEKVAKVKLNRPNVLNAINTKMRKELIEVFDKLSEDDTKSVIITGEGDAFSTGGDVKQLNELVEEDAGPSVELDRIDMMNKLVTKIMNLKKPVIAKVNGPAVGAGCCLALASDIVIASEDAKFGIVFARIGLIPDTGGIFLLPRLVGLRKAKQLAFNANLIDAEKAKEIGLVNKVVSSDKLDGETWDLAKEYAEGPTIAYGMMKVLLNRSFSSPLEKNLEQEAYANSLLTQTDYFKEKVREFTAKKE